ncbi:MAG: NADH-quinone oxidoreductase subunit C, partial [Candidatus Obscuribacterales bacterium]|nr:NADH-quinone oxidoreductase subunit C [Candidatus Obscuribacterales bacterium]
MKIERKTLPLKERASFIKKWLEDPSHHLGLISSIDGHQLITLVLDAAEKTAVLYETALESDSYPSLTPRISQAHWQERSTWDMFGLLPEGHPRLKPAVLHLPYEQDFFPLRISEAEEESHRHAERMHKFLEVKGAGVYEIPVGPIHAGIIEPGHFRFSCLGEVILNLEIHLGYVHRGVEKRLSEVPWRKSRFVAESAASDSLAAYALANARAFESILQIEASEKGRQLQILAHEIERVAIHLSDMIGFAADIGFTGIAASFSRLRGQALRLADLLSGSRFLKGFIKAGGVARDPGEQKLAQIRDLAQKLLVDIEPVSRTLLENHSVLERMEGVGRVSPAIARNFGLTGVAGRASALAYDARIWSELHPEYSMVLESGSDVLARAKVRIQEIFISLKIIKQVAGQSLPGPISIELPSELPADSVGLGIVEGHRGEIIHLVLSDKNGKLKRYAIKDPSVNNWTALAIAVRNNLVADFPLCNKSFSLAYSGH